MKVGIQQMAPWDRGAGSDCGLEPIVSVMIPAYEPNEFLLKAIESVVSQNFDSRRMEVVVVDDQSPRVDVSALVGGGGWSDRVRLHRNQENLGLAGNWNECVRLARGKVVHILHQDDWISDGFYSRMLPAFQKHPRVGMAFCRHAYVDEKGLVFHETEKERWFRGRLINWLDRIAVGQRIQCPSVLVRRSTYLELGGYRSDLIYALDWEMWVRIAARYDVWYDPKLMAYYRIHSQNETSRLALQGKLMQDELKTIDIFSKYLPPDRRAALVNQATRAIEAKWRRAPNEP